MAIPINKYVDILSAAGGVPPVQEKEPIGRWFTTNVLAPMGKVLEFTSSQQVLAYFGSTSEEYAYADKYFSFISKKYTQPKRISFARYNGTSSPIYSSIVSGNTSFPLASFVGEQSLTLSWVGLSGLTSQTISVNFGESQDSLTSVASEIQDAIREVEAFANATVEYSTQYNGGRFIFTAVESDTPTIQLNAFSGDLASLVGWDITNAIVGGYNDGTNSISQEVERVMDISDNCYTFAFIEQLSDEQIEAVADWNTTANSQFIYMIWAKSSNSALTLANTLEPYDCAIVFDNLQERQVYQPMAAGACVNFARQNASINFMYQQYPDDTPTVTTALVSDNFDENKINYYGATQTAGRQVAFFQRGKCFGTFADMSIAFNAIWLKNSVIVQTLNMFLLNDSIPANEDGKAKIVANLNKVWSQGVFNGAILQGKVLSSGEKAFIEAQTNDELAYQEVIDKGYWFDCYIDTDVNNGEKYFSFKLIYGAADQIRKVEGTNIALTSAQ